MTTSISGSSGVTFPAGGTGNPAGTVVGTTDTQTLTNKTLTSPTITGPSISSAVMTTMASSVITAGTAVASTSGTSIDFSSLPTWVKKITVMFSGVSLSATAHFLLQVGTGGTPTSTGYVSTSFGLATAGAPSTSSTAGYVFYAGGATGTFSGIITIANITGNTWVANGVLAQTAGTASNTIGGGSVALGGVLNILRITTTSTDTFDAGSINILYE